MYAIMVMLILYHQGSELFYRKMDMFLYFVSFLNSGMLEVVDWHINEFK